MITGRMLEELRDAQARDHTERRRDDFARAALIGLLADGEWPTADVNPEHDPRPVDHHRRELARRAWQIAHSMMANAPGLPPHGQVDRPLPPTPDRPTVTRADKVPGDIAASDLGGA